MSTPQFSESAHPREQSGQFATKPTADAAGGLNALAAPEVPELAPEAAAATDALRSGAQVSEPPGASTGHLGRRTRAIDAKRRAAVTAAGLPSGEASSYEYGREYAYARQLALMSNPDVARDREMMDVVAGKMLRSGSDELTEQAETLFPREPTWPERHAAVQSMAEFAAGHARMLATGRAMMPAASRGQRDAGLEAAAAMATSDPRKAALLENAIAERIDMGAPGAAQAIMKLAFGDTGRRGY